MCFFFVWLVWFVVFLCFVFVFCFFFSFVFFFFVFFDFFFCFIFLFYVFFFFFFFVLLFVFFFFVFFFLFCLIVRDRISGDRRGFYFFALRFLSLGFWGGVNGTLGFLTKWPDGNVYLRR